MLNNSTKEIEYGAEKIYEEIKTKLNLKLNLNLNNKLGGLLIGKNGSLELESVFFSQYSENIKKRLALHAGIWSDYYKWDEEYKNALSNADIMAVGWYPPLIEHENHLMNKLNPNIKKIRLRSLEPYYVSPEKRWTSLLNGQKVAIVSSFTESIMKQISNRDKIWLGNVNSLLPSDTEWIPIRTYYSPIMSSGNISTSWPSGISSWKDAVNLLVQEVIASGAKIALIGCGGLGMIIGNELKKRGVISIVLGGAIQILFGIKGGRWLKHDIISKFFNESWIFPSPDETPINANKVEGGCYW